ncbi:MAG: NAD(P)H-quinone oxidoreductase [Myxococcota bacterium]
MIESRAVVITKPGGPEVLEVQTRSVRDPGPGEVRVAIEAAGLNRADTLQRRGAYPAPPGAPADVPGLEFAGRIESLGAPILGDWKVGDPVMGIVGGGGMGQHVVLHERELLRVPEGMSLTDAAAIPEVFLTAYDALFLQAELAMGEVALVHAIASGIGTAALQLNAAAGVTTIGTSRSEAKLARCAELGLEHAVHTADGLFAAKVQEIAGGAQVVLDTVGAKYLNENLKALRLQGRMVTIGLVGGIKAEANLALILRKRLCWRGSVLRARPLEEKAALIQRFSTEILPLFAAGRLRPVIDEVLPMKDASEAHARMDASETFGKLVLSWSQ